MKYYDLRLRPKKSAGKNRPVISLQLLDDGSAIVSVRGKEKMFDYVPDNEHVRQAFDYAAALADQLGGEISLPGMTMTGPDA